MPTAIGNELQQDIYSAQITLVDDALRGALAFTMDRQEFEQSPFEPNIERILSYRRVSKLRISELDRSLGKFALQIKSLQSL